MSIRRRSTLGCLAASPLLPLHGLAAPAQEASGDAGKGLVLKMGGFLQAPLVMGASQEPIRGLLRDFIVQEVQPRTALRFEWLEPSSLARILKGLQDGSLDILMSRAEAANVHDEVGRFAWHTVESSPTVAVHVDSPLREITSLEQMAGMSLGRLYGGPVPVGFEGIRINWVFTSGLNWQLTNLRMVERGRLDGSVFYNRFSPAYLAKSEGIRLRLLSLPLPVSRFFMWHSLKSKPAALAEFDRVAGPAFRSGRFAQMLETALK